MDIESFKDRCLSLVRTDLEKLIVKANFSRFVSKNECEVLKYVKQFPMIPVKYKNIGAEEDGLVYYYVVGIYPVMTNILEIPVSKDIAEISDSGELIIHDKSKLFKCLNFK